MEEHSLLTRFQQSLHRWPDRLAVVADESFSYTKLNEKSLRLAEKFHQCGVESGDIVVIFLPRVANVIVAMLAAMRIGAAYLIVEDNDDDREFKRTLVLQSDVSLVLSSEEHCDFFGQKQQHCISDVHAFADASDGLSRQNRSLRENTSYKPNSVTTAYLVHTSGSTGRPKRVAISHKNLAHYIYAIEARLGIDEGLHYAHVSSLAADLGNTCLFLPLSTGGTIHLIHDNVRRDPAGLADYLIEQNIDVLKITPSHWQAMFLSIDKKCRALREGKAQRSIIGQEQQLYALKYLVLGGEALSKTLAIDTLNSTFVKTLVNHYGPSETTIGVAARAYHHAMEIQTLTSETVLVGKALGETKFLVQTESDTSIVSEGRGELFIGGPSVAQGYLGDPKKTEQSFIEDFRQGKVYYRSGDIVQVDAEGNLEILGRRDRQVKLNGHRVELESIESLCRAQTGVRNSAVVYELAQGRPKLSLLLDLERPEPLTDVRERLTKIIPSYAIPSEIYVIKETFPLNSNGKTDLNAIRELLEEYRRENNTQKNISDEGLINQSGLDIIGDISSYDSGLLWEIAKIWKKCLGCTQLSIDDDFFNDLGANSLDVIQVVSELQALGYSISTGVFLAKPTLAGLVTELGNLSLEGACHHSLSGSEAVDKKYDSHLFSPSQEWFFKQAFANRNHWNQALLMYTDCPVVPSLLQNALEEILRTHPILSSKFLLEKQGVVACHHKAKESVFSLSSVDSGWSEQKAKEVIDSRAERLNEAICLDSADVFKVHLFQQTGGVDRILFVAHHLCVDAVSWRIILTDLTRFYGALRIGKTLPVLTNSPTFWNYVEHRKACVSQCSRTYQTDFSPELYSLPAEDNKEKSAVSYWLGFSEDETTLLNLALLKSTKAPLHNAILGVFIHLYCLHQKKQRILVDVEGHGRNKFNDEIDTARMVGWFTTVEQLQINCNPQENINDTICKLDQALDEAPSLVDDITIDNNEYKTAKLCYNYLGNSIFACDEELSLRPSRLEVGSTRGGENNRVYDLKLSSRVVDGQFILDLSFVPGIDSEEVVSTTLIELKRTMLASIGREIGRETDVNQHLYRKEGASTGMLNFVPSQAFSSKSVTRKKDYQNIFITGATGFIGIYILFFLLRDTHSKVYCLMRDESISHARKRMVKLFQWYFPSFNLEQFHNRIEFVIGNSSEVNYGLDLDAYTHLCSIIDCIYDLAADTRLYGDSEMHQRANVGSIKNAIEMADFGRKKHLHYVSTLAVSGFNTEASPVRFSESELHINQKFLNEYEYSKFVSEQLVNDFIMAGGIACIYRVGNVSAHSKTGKFRFDSRHNRLVQKIRAIVKLGKIPEDLSENMVLSAVDEVALGIFKLSHSNVVGSGTYHVDAEYSVSFVEIIAQLRKSGVKLEKIDSPNFSELFKPYTEDKDIALGQYWANRPARNIIFDHSRSRKLLQELGVEFSPFDNGRLELFIQHLSAVGEFSFD